VHSIQIEAAAVDRRIDMIEVRSQPAIERNPEGGWWLTFWMGEAFDYTTPFRTALNDMAQTLGHGSPSSIELPEYQAHEDFVEGTLQFGDEVLRVYYEHSLSYLSLSTSSYEVLCDVSARLQSCLQVA
jgi:hypothetical protein